MTIETKRHIHIVTSHAEEKFVATIQHLKNHNNFFQREVLSRILAIVFPIFSIVMLGLKMAAGGIDLGQGIWNSVKNKEFIFNKIEIGNSLKSMGLNLIGSCFGLFVGIFRPDLLTKFSYVETKIPPPPRSPLSTIDILPQTDVTFQKTEQKLVDQIYDELEDLTKNLDKKNIKYTLCAKSLLGSTLHGGLIPSERTATIAIDKKDEAKLLTLKKVVKNEFGYQRSHIHILPMEQDKKTGIYTTRHSREIFTKKEWNSITNVPFGHLTLKGVAPPFAEKCLIRKYGQNWESSACYSHASHSKISKLTIDHRTIAMNALNTMTDEEMDKQFQLNKFFGSVHFINLDRDTHRRESIQEELRSVGLQEGEYSRYSACLGKELPKEIWNRIESWYDQTTIDKNTSQGQAIIDKQHMGHAGCYMSHFRLIKEINEKYNQAVKKLKTLSTNDPRKIQEAEMEVKKYSSVFIVEGDNKFARILPENVTGTGWKKVISNQITKEGTGKIFYQAMRDLPDDWDMVSITSLSYEEPIQTTNPNLQKLTSACCSITAYGISARMYPRFLQQLSKIEQKGKMLWPVDEEVGLLQKKANCFVIMPPISVQREGDSSILGTQAKDTHGYWQAGEKK